MIRRKKWWQTNKRQEIKLIRFPVRKKYIKQNSLSIIKQKIIIEKILIIERKKIISSSVN